jgi:hypothetical protein
MGCSFLSFPRLKSYDLYVCFAWQLVDESVFTFSQSLRVCQGQFPTPHDNMGSDVFRLARAFEAGTKQV